jgi:rhodanese-related sulfurtransferase
MSVTTITPQQLHDITHAGRSVELLDVRTPGEFREVHVNFARNVPLNQLERFYMARSPSGASQPLYVICQTGGRAHKACEKLMRAGHLNVVSIEGGTQAWAAAGFPVVRGQARMSLERQVRIAAGLLVVFGTSLGYFVHPYWLGLTAFVGAGLAFAGITNACGMSMLLAKMPWNQVGACTASTGGSGASMQHPTIKVPKQPGRHDASSSAVLIHDTCRKKTRS